MADYIPDGVVYARAHIFDESHDKLIAYQDGVVKFVHNSATPTPVESLVWDASGNITIPTLPTPPHALLSAAHTDVVPASVVAGDLIIGNATPKWARLAIGAAPQVLGITGGLPAWQAQSYIDHGALTGLLDDDHTQYALLAGRAGGNTFTGFITATLASGDTNLLTVENTNSGDSVKLGVFGGFPGVWMNQASPSLTNFAFLGSDTFAIFNAAQDVYFGTANTYCMRVYVDRGIGIGDTSGGTGGSSPGANNLKVDGDINAVTTLSVNGKAFSFGANDSAGAGFRTVKIANA